MGVFQASGVVAVDGRAAVNVVVSFAVAGGRLPRLLRPPPPAVRTDKAGRFVQDGFDERVGYVATASAPGVDFGPQGVAFDAAHPKLRLRGKAASFTASGVVRVALVVTSTGKPPGIADVQISFVRVAGRLDLPVPAAVVTGADGTWQQSGFQVGGVYQAVPSKAGFGFTPASAEVRADVSSEFTGGSSVFGVSGRIVTTGGAAEPAAAVRFERTSGAGAVPAVVTTDGAGSFTQNGFDRGSRYRVTPSKAGLTFDPPSRDVTFAPNAFPMVGASFLRHTTLVVTGQVLTTGGAGLVGAVLTFTRTTGNGAVPLPVTTTSNGEYRAEGLDAGTTYTVTLVRDQFACAPTRLRSANPGTATLNLTAFPAYEVSGRVIQVDNVFPDFGALQQVLQDAPGVPGAVVSFQRRDAGPAVPVPSVAAADGTFRQRGFEVGPGFVAVASAAGFVGTPIIGFPNLGGFFGGSGGATGDGASAAFSNAQPTRLDNLFLLLARAT